MGDGLLTTGLAGVETTDVVTLSFKLQGGEMVAKGETVEVKEFVLGTEVDEGEVVVVEDYHVGL